MEVAINCDAGRLGSALLFKERCCKLSITLRTKGNGRSGENAIRPSPLSSAIDFNGLASLTGQISEKGLMFIKTGYLDGACTFVGLNILGLPNLTLQLAIGAGLDWIRVRADAAYTGLARGTTHATSRETLRPARLVRVAERGHLARAWQSRVDGNLLEVIFNLILARHKGALLE